jgi:hypothetical protein
MQSLDLLGLQRDRRIAPTEADIRMMAFGFRELANLLDKGQRLPEIAKLEAPLDAVSFFSRVSGGIPPRQGVQVLLTRASVMLLAPRINRRVRQGRRTARYCELTAPSYWMDP